MTTPRTRLTALAGAALVTVIAAGCTQSPPDPGPKVTNVTPPASTASTSTTPPASSTTPTPTTSAPMSAEEQAYANAEKTYRAWVVNYAAAEAAGFDPKKLDSRLATPALIDILSKQFKTFQQQKGGAGKYSQDIRWMKPDRYRVNETVTFQMCAVTNARFLLNGKDVTITADGKPSPVKTKPTLHYVSMETIDNGKTWRSSTVIYPSNPEKESC